MRTTVACVIAALLALSAGCGSDEEPTRPRAPTRTVDAAAEAERMETGARMFAEHCQSCHTLLGRVNTGTTGSLGPSLDEVIPEHAYVRARVTSGWYEMQSFEGEMSDDERDAVIGYVASVAGRGVGDVGEPSPLGEQVYAEHCASCHSIADRPEPGDAEWPGTDFRNVRPSARLVEEMVVRGYLQRRMPSFKGKLTKDEIIAVATYVSATAGPYAAKRPARRQ